MSVSSVLLLQPVIFSLKIISLNIKVHQIRVILELPFSIFKLVLHCIICQVTYLSCETDSQGICSAKTDSWFHICALQRARQRTEQIKYRTVPQPGKSTWIFFSLSTRTSVFWFFVFFNSAKDNNVKIKQCLRHVFYQ